MDVTDQLVYMDLKDPYDTWASVPEFPVRDVWVARTVLRSRCKGVSVRVMNLASYPVTLREATVLSELEEMKVIERDPVEMVGSEATWDREAGTE